MSFSFLSVKISVVVSVNLSNWFGGVIKYSVGSMYSSLHMLYAFDMLCFCLFLLLVGKMGARVTVYLASILCNFPLYLKKLVGLRAIAKGLVDPYALTAIIWHYWFM